MSHTTKRLFGVGVSMLLAVAAISATLALSATGASGQQTSLPTTATQWNPQSTNVPYLAWAGEQVLVEKCFPDPYVHADSTGLFPDMSKLSASFIVEDWSGDPSYQPQILSPTVQVFWSKTRGELCAKADFVSLFPGMARIQLDISDPSGISGFIPIGPGNLVLSHQFLAGWMTINTPSLAEMSASDFAPTAQTEAAAELGDPSGDGQFVAGNKPGYVDVKVTGSMPMNGAWAALIGKSSVTLPADWPLLAMKLATSGIAGDTQADATNRWDIANTPAGYEGHVTQSPACLDSTFGSAPLAPAGTDAVDDCTGGGATGPFSTQFGVLSSNTAIGPFDPVRSGDTLLPNGILDWADAPMPATRVDVSIAPNSGAATDTTGVGYLVAADKAKTYSRDFLGSETNTTPHNEYAPFYDQYIPATSRPGDAYSGVDGAAANNFPGFLVNGEYHNWDFAATLSTAGGGATSCLRSDPWNPQTATNPASFYQLPSGPQSVAVYTDNHGEAQVQYVPGLGFYFNSLIANGSAVTNANGGCDLQSLYGVQGGLGSSTISATARYPYKPVDFPDMTSAPITKQVASLWSKTMAAFPKGEGTNGNDAARIVTTHAQDIDGSPFGGEVMCFAADGNAENMTAFYGTVGGHSYAGERPAGPGPWTGTNNLCVKADSSGNAAVEVFNSNATKVNVVADFWNEGILRHMSVDFGSGDSSTTTTTTPTTTTATTTVTTPGTTVTLPGATVTTTTTVTTQAPSTPTNGGSAPAPTEGSGSSVTSTSSTPVGSSSSSTAATPSTPSTAGATPATSGAPKLTTVKKTTASKRLKPSLSLVRLLTPRVGKHYVLLHVKSTQARARVRLTLVEQIAKKTNHGKKMVRHTVTRTVTVRAGRNVKVSVPNSVLSAKARLV